MNSLLKSIAVVLAAATQFSVAHAAGKSTDQRPPASAVLLCSYNRGDATDRSWHAKNGTMTNGATVTAGQRYLALDGSNDFVRHADSDNFSFVSGGNDLPFTCMAWVYLDSAPNANQNIFYKASVSPPAGEWNLRVSTATSPYPALFIWKSDFTARIGRRTNTTLSTGRWYHIAGTYNGGKTAASIKVFVDGVQSDTADNNSGTFTGMTNTATPLDVGGVNGTETIDGNIDDARVYNRELTPAEIAAIFSAGRELP